MTIIRKIFKKKLLFLPFFLLTFFAIRSAEEPNIESNTAPHQGANRLVDEWNQRLDAEGGFGHFEIIANKGIIFSGGITPSWAIDQQLDAIGLTQRLWNWRSRPF